MLALALNLDRPLDDEHAVRKQSQMTTAVLSECDRCGEVEALHDDCDACFEKDDAPDSAFERCEHYTCRSCGMAL